MRQAEAIILAEGFTAVTVDELAQRLECSKATLYSLARTKEQLVLASCRTQSIAIPDDLALIGVDDLPVSSLAVPALTTIGMDLTAAAGNLTAGILATVGAPVPAAPSRPDVGDILVLVQRETT
ncbi:substrate-binding domain-containing protein [Streptomyces griseorubiginosus]|uniref:substrate-binding domain-containing protein n=1 Tax=Streptomyces griseorubiginosus TaxID=67304 RepID=UPI0036E45DC1